MELFNLPHTTKVNKVIPKNAFDAYTNAKQKKQFTDFISRIIWLNKLSPETVNLEAGEVREIQLFRIELKSKQNIQPLLNIIDKAIPYHIIFILLFENEIFLSTSPKHPHPVNEDNAVIDGAFSSDWFNISENRYTIQLKKNLDAVYLYFCLQLCGMGGMPFTSLKELVDYDNQIDSLKKEIAKTKIALANCTQFKKKVEINMKLQSLVEELSILRIGKSETPD